MTTHRLSRPFAYSLSAPDGDHISQEILRKGVGYEFPAMRAVAALLPPSSTVIDVGANIGNHAVFWAMGGAKVHAFEPNPEALDWLSKNVNDNGLHERVIIHDCAVGAFVGRSRIESSPKGNLGGTVVSPDAGGDLSLVTLDSLGLPRVDAIKVDVEGHELDVVRGARMTLEGQRPLLMLETWSASHRADLDRELRQYGYLRMQRPVAGAPAYLYLPDRSSLLAAYRTPAVLAAATAIAAGRTKGRVLRLVKRLGA